VGQYGEALEYILLCREKLAGVQDLPKEEVTEESE